MIPEPNYGQNPYAGAVVTGGYYIGALAPGQTATIYTGSMSVGQTFNFGAGLTVSYAFSPGVLTALPTTTFVDMNITEPSGGVVLLAPVVCNGDCSGGYMPVTLSFTNQMANSGFFFQSGPGITSGMAGTATPPGGVVSASFPYTLCGAEAGGWTFGFTNWVPVQTPSGLTDLGESALQYTGVTNGNPQSAPVTFYEPGSASAQQLASGGGGPILWNLPTNGLPAQNNTLQSGFNEIANQLNQLMSGQYLSNDVLVSYPTNGITVSIGTNIMNGYSNVWVMNWPSNGVSFTNGALLATVIGMSNFMSGTNIPTAWAWSSNVAYQGFTNAADAASASASAMSSYEGAMGTFITSITGPSQDDVSGIGSDMQFTLPGGYLMDLNPLDNGAVANIFASVKALFTWLLALFYLLRIATDSWEIVKLLNAPRGVQTQEATTSSVLQA
jgi:hypothetical protein